MAQTLGELAEEQQSKAPSLSTYDTIRLRKEHKEQISEGKTDEYDFNKWYANLVSSVK